MLYHIILTTCNNEHATQPKMYTQMMMMMSRRKDAFTCFSLAGETLRARQQMVMHADH